jgi:tyrosyl-tRNA synthetase
MTTEESIKEVLSRGVSAFIDPEGAFEKKLIQKAKREYPKDVIIKFGVDPNRPDIHLGHAIAFRKLQKLQELGCKVVFLIGDYTAQIGDPTGKSKTRPLVEGEEVKKNAESFFSRVSFFLDTENKEKYMLVTNSTWFQKTNLLSFMQILRQITYARLVERDMFQERIKSKEHLYMHEMMYPVLQGIDSNEIADLCGSCDLEIGGTDQTFNMLMGRDILKMKGKEQQAVLSVDLLVGLDGKEKMSKSLGNYIGITDAPNDMYGKIMSIPDSLIIKYFSLCTDLSVADIKKMEKSLENGENPKDHKMHLAREIVTIYHDEKVARSAEENFSNTFKKGGVPDDAEEAKAKIGESLSELLLKSGIVESKSDFARLVKEGAISEVETEEKISDREYKIERAINLRIGKKRFLKIKI